MAEPLDQAASLTRTDRLEIRQWDENGIELVVKEVTVEQLAPALITELAFNSDKLAGLVDVGDGLTLSEATISADVKTVAGRAGDVSLSIPDVAGLGTAAAADVGTATGTVAAGDDPRIVGAAQAALIGQPEGIATLGGDGKLSLAQIPSALTAGITAKGLWNADTNTPTLATGVGVNGDMWTVSVAGTTALDGTDTWEVGDQVLFTEGAWSRLPLSATLGTMAAQDADNAAVSKISIGAPVNSKLAVLSAPEVDSTGRLISFVRRGGRRVIAEAMIRLLYVGELIGTLAPETLTLINTISTSALGKLSLFSSVARDSTGRITHLIRRDGRMVIANAKVNNLSLGRDPSTAMDAVTKQYADAISSGLSPSVEMQLLLEPSVDFDAPTDGTTDASTAVNACVTAAIAAGDRHVWIDNVYNVPSLSSDCRDVIFIGPGSLIGHTLPTSVIPNGAPAPPPPAPTFFASRDCPVLAASIAATSTGTIVLLGDSITTPDGAVTFVYADSLANQIARAFYDANPGATLTIVNRGAGGQSFASWADVHNGAGTVPEWLTDTEAPMLSYVESLTPHCVVIALGINDSSNFKYSDLTTILAEMATWTPAPDVVFVNGFGFNISDTEATATSQRQGALFEQGAIRSFAKAHNHGLLDTAAEDDIARFGFSPETLPLLQDAEMVGGTLINTNYALDLPWTMPHAVFGWGAKFIIVGAGDGWGDLGNHLTFQIGSAFNANMAGCFFEIRRNVDYSVDWRVTTTLIAEGADADLVFIDWTPIAGFTSQLNGGLILTIQKRGSVLYVALGGGSAGTPTTNNDTIILYNGPVPSGGGAYTPIIRCAAGAVSGALYISGGGTYLSNALSQRVEHAPEQLYMPDLLDREYSSDTINPVRPWGGLNAHPGMLALRRIVSRVINANDFRG